VLTPSQAFASKELPENLKKAGMTLSSVTGPDVRLPAGSPTLQFVEIIMILRGIFSVIQSTNRWLQGDIEEMLRYPQSQDLPAHTSDLSRAFDVLDEDVRNCSDIEDEETKHMYLEQISRLRDISRCRTTIEWDGHMFSFFVGATPAFINGIKQGNAIALAIFAHWGACLRCFDHHWWANGWGMTLVHDICSIIDLNTWSRVMEWPMRQCGFANS
jgi:hypothetical protein